MKFTHYTNSLPYIMETTSRVIQEAITKDLKKSGLNLSHEEFVILDTIFCHPGILQIDLAKKVLKTRAHTGKFLNTLEARGLIRREKRIKGSRQTILLNFLTDDGVVLHKTAVKEIKKSINDTMPAHLSDEDIDKLSAFLNELKIDIVTRKNIRFN